MLRGARDVHFMVGALLAAALAVMTATVPTAAAQTARCALAADGSGQIAGALNAVAAVSASNAWGVGMTDGYQTLVEHWDGTAWQHVRSPSPGGGGHLFAVAVLSARIAWAVGGTAAVPQRPGGGPLTAVILRWGGSRWRAVPTHLRLGPDQVAALQGVAVTSAHNAWAVGYITHILADGNLTSRALIMRWNGRTWRRVPTRLPFALQAVAATSAHNAWAVGTNDAVTKLVILHWNGVGWRKVPSGTPRGDGVLFGVAATSARNAWAVGQLDSAAPLILQWNGTTWRHVQLPDTGRATLYSVAATSARNAWAIGPGKNLVFLQWNGVDWQQTPSPTPLTNGLYYAVAAISPHDAWAVGTTSAYDFQTLIAHWNGIAWQQAPVP